jgi:hypothetical protein
VHHAFFHGHRQLFDWIVWASAGIAPFSLSDAALESASTPRHVGDRVYVVHAPVFFICRHPLFALPVDPLHGEQFGS